MTAQIHEKLILDGVETSMAFCPPLPAGHPRLRELVPGEVSRDEGNYFLFTTACWRSYQGTWEIRDNRFYLVTLQGRFQLQDDAPLLADWFSGILRVPQGERLQYVHMGFGSVFEQELHIKVERGSVVGTRIFDNRGKKHDQWEIGERNLPGGENRFPGDDEA